MMKQVKAAAVMVMLGASFVLGAEDKFAETQTLPANPQQCSGESETVERSTDDSKDNNPYGLLLLPVNLAPDIVADIILCYGKGVSLFFEYPDEPAWGAMMLIYAPFSGIYHGVADAAGGYPFWSVYLLRSDKFSPFSRDGQK